MAADIIFVWVLSRETHSQIVGHIFLSTPDNIALVGLAIETHDIRKNLLHSCYWRISAHFATIVLES